MATVVNVPKDTRYGDLGQGLGGLVVAYMAKKEENELNRQAQEAMDKIYQTKDLDEANAIYNSLPIKVREKKGGLLRQTIQDRHPGFEQLTGFTSSGSQKTIFPRKGGDPNKALADAGLTTENVAAAPAWGVDVPGIGVEAANSKEEAEALSAGYAKKGIFAPVLNPSATSVRLQSENTEASVENSKRAAAAQKADAAARLREFETTQYARMQVEFQADPLATEAGVVTLIKTEGDADTSFKNVYGTQSKDGIIFDSAGKQNQYTTAKTTYQRLVRRGTDPAKAFELAKTAGDMGVMKSLFDDAKNDALPSQLTTVDKDLKRQFGLGLGPLNDMKAYIASHPNLEEYNPSNPSTIIQVPIKGQNKTMLWAMVDGELIPLGVK